ncbi:MAG: aspartate carbamoyltransferase [bacterium]|nr:aspartate carbamoyltransferase [bacterium]
METFSGRSIISMRDFTREEIHHVLETARQVDENPKKYANVLDGRIMATLFFEPSTRTRLSFESAMTKLGGRVIGFADPSSSSTKKGESLADSIKIVESYADLIVMRHPVAGSARFASEIAHIPVINGGDGANQHPSQTFLDLYTILKAKGRLDNLTIGFMGDLKYGRTVHSLAHALAHYNCQMYFVSPKGLEMPSDLLEELANMGISYQEHANYDSVKGNLDILYVTRIQRERFGTELDYDKIREGYNISKQFLKGCNPDLKILHPLPRVDELSEEVDSTPYALYFQQAANGIPTRMALIGLVMGVLS